MAQTVFGSIVIRIALVVSIVATTGAAGAATIDVVASDSAQTNIAKIEAAGPGDEVVVHPGSYSFRLYLEKQGTASAPIVIRAFDPADRPVWDLDGDVTANFPGSYGGGDSGRGIWQITGSYYRVSGIVFRHGTDGQANGSGLRLKSCDHVSLHDCLFEQNDNGIQGAGESTLVEFCEFAKNGDPSLSEGSHNLYIHGGTITMRYSYVHDATQGQNFHVRANDAVFEYNWFARSSSYMGDMMSCTIDPCDPVQHLLLRGNVFVRGTPKNDGQELVMYNDQGTPNLSFELTLINNTFIGNGDGAPLIHFANDTGDIQNETAIFNNNVAVDFGSVFRIDATGLSNTTASGANNWLSTTTSGTSGLTGSVTGADPGFADAPSMSFVPAAGSPLIGGADDTLSGLPDKEYYQDESAPMMWRARESVHDIGAFESTTSGTPTGAYGPGQGGSSGGAASGGASSGGSANGGSTSGGASAGGSSGANANADGSDDSGGCGCHTTRSAPSPWGIVLGLGWLSLIGRRRR